MKHTKIEHTKIEFGFRTRERGVACRQPGGVPGVQRS
jgi:hypothetical protein